MDLLLDHLLRLFSSGGQLAAGSLVVTACDVMLLIPTEVAASADWSAWASSDAGASEGSVAGLAIAADAGKYAPNHGVYCLAREGEMESGADGSGKCGVMGVRRCVCFACRWFRAYAAVAGVRAPKCFCLLRIW